MLCRAVSCALVVACSRPSTTPTTGPGSAAAPRPATETLAKGKDFEVRLQRGADDHRASVVAATTLELPGAVFDPVTARLDEVDAATGRWIVTIATERLRPIASPPTAGMVDTSQRTEGFRREVSFAIRITDGTPELVCHWPGSYAHVSPHAGSHHRTVMMRPLDDAPGVLVDTTEYHREHEGQREHAVERIEIPEAGPCVRAIVEGDRDPEG